MNFEDEAQLLLQRLQTTISETEQLHSEHYPIDLDSKLGYELCMPLVIEVLQSAYNAGKRCDESSIVDITNE
jgi:hypothetical protein